MWRSRIKWWLTLQNEALLCTSQCNVPLPSPPAPSRQGHSGELTENWLFCRYQGLSWDLLTTHLRTSKRIKKWDSEPTAGKSLWEMGKKPWDVTNFQADLQWGLWVFSGGSRKGSQGALPSLIFRQNWGPKGWNFFFGDCAHPFSKGLDVCPPPPPSRSQGLNTALVLLEVTYHFKAAAVTPQSILGFWFCNFYVLLVVILKKRKSKSAHLVGAASRVRLKQVIKRSRFFFGLSWPIT